MAIGSHTRMGATVSRRAFIAASSALAISRACFAQGTKPSLRIGMANNVMTMTYPYITNSQQFRFFDQEGVATEVVMGQGSPQILSLLVAGTVDLVFCNAEPIIKLDAQRGL